MINTATAKAGNEINISLIQEQIDRLRFEITVHHPKFSNSSIKELTEKRDQWQAILAAVEQQGKQDPVGKVIRDFDGYKKVRWVGNKMPAAETLLYASPVQPDNEEH